ncbi:PREDICTED: uncharacterized protein LOC104790732 [Camelina sativa]|uniref:Uncharacterized protein LOC104790732 n=1 Tax=Camelina sativa TaxID=90675 RepID=A0ABM0ZEY5_CAMSA|nr:PREDICTED: uncharacterized protein LOC104790732 [Camelina sativa]
MEVELGRPPTIPEVFLRTHTKKDGTFVDKKAQAVHEAYKKRREAKLAAQDNDESSDGTSRRSELSHEEDDELFLQSTYINDRGTYFGVGSLGSYINGKRKYPGSSSTFTTLQQQLEDANRKIEEQAALQAERDAEASRVAAEALRVASEQQEEISRLASFLKTNPNYVTFLESQTNDLNPADFQS